MKKSLLALAALTAFAGAASAQSSVTLFGVVDLSANSVKAGSQSTKVLASNQMNSNRFGFRGTEDLGGGLKAGFWLEAGMDNASGWAGGGSGNVTPADGTSSQLFNRRSTVSLLGNFGEIRLGRDYLPTFWNIAVFDVNGANGAGEGLNLHSTLGSGATTLVRGNNTIAYHLPALGGLYGQFTVSAGEGQTGVKYSGGRIGYGAGPFSVAIATSATKTATSDDFKVTNIGGSYAIGGFTLYGYWNKNTYGAAEQKVYELSAAYQLGAGQLRGSLGKADGTGGSVNGQSAKLWGAGYYYDLSKRTTVYGLYGSIKNSGGAGFTVLSVPAINASAKNDTSSAFTLGVKHSF
jgi:predicted porin